MNKEDAIYSKSYSAIRKDNLPFVATWIDIDNVIRSEISQKNINITWHHLHVKHKKKKKAELIDVRAWNGGDQGLEGGGERVIVGQNTISSYRMNKFWGI